MVEFVQDPAWTSSVIASGEDADDSLSDLELSFASGISLQSPDRSCMSMSSEVNHLDLMDISPAPPPSLWQGVETHLTSKRRTRAHTSAARLFGDDSTISPPSMKTFAKQSRPLPAATLQDWTSNAQYIDLAVGTSQGAPPEELLLSGQEDAMEVDTSFVGVEKLLLPGSPSTAGSPHRSPTPLTLSAAPTVTQFNSLFYDTGSPDNLAKEFSPPLSSGRPRSLSPPPAYLEAVDRCSSPPVLDSSPSVSKLERIRSGPLLNRLGKPAFPGLGAPPADLKRSHRPVLSAMIPFDGSRLHSAHTELPKNYFSTAEGYEPPSRRAISALLPPADYLELSSPISPLDGMIEASSPAQAYTSRQRNKDTQHLLDVGDQQPVAAASAAVKYDVNLAESPSARYMRAGIPGFGDQEAHGKILPCHKASEDGLMRISCQTLDDMLDGRYKSRVAEFHVVDCRFDYEYNGGHIPGAINVRTAAVAEDLFLGAEMRKPEPCTSADLTKKTVIVFHCEFSAKRAPTFAKHLRAKDRALNHHVYPKIHYPELYILEGGYCQYYKDFSARCQPQGYISMDDPLHAVSRREDLDQFRKTKFGRVKSYAYGDGESTMFSGNGGSLTKRNTAPSGTVAGSGTINVSTAANAARARRVCGTLKTLTEDEKSTRGEEDAPGFSPCPPTSKGSVRQRGLNAQRRLSRAETFGPAKMVWR